MSFVYLDTFDVGSNTFIEAALRISTIVGWTGKAGIDSAKSTVACQYGDAVEVFQVKQEFSEISNLIANST